MPDSPDEGKRQQLLEVKGEVRLEGGLEESSDRLLVLEPHCRQPEEERTADGSKEPSPVVTDGKVRRRYLNTEENTCESLKQKMLT